MRPINLVLYLQESEASGARPSMGLGKVFLEPYEVEFSLHAASYRLVQRFTEHLAGPEVPQQQLHVVLTPALPHGQMIRGPREQSDKFAEVYVGQSPEVWNAVPPHQWYSMLLEIILSAIRYLKDWRRLPLEAYESAVRATLAEQDAVQELQSSNQQAEAASISSDLKRSLQYPTWNRLAVDDRMQALAQVGEAARRAGFDLEPRQGAPFGRNSASLAVLQDRATQIEFVLIPGGGLRPGVADERWPQLRDVFRKILEPEEDLDSLLPDGGDKLRAREPLDVEPLLLSRAPVPVQLPGIEQILPHLEDESNSESELPPLLFLEWPDLAAVLRAFRWSLPGSVEFEWALRCGDDRFFPWGDDPAPIQQLYYDDAQALGDYYSDEHNLDLEVPENPKFEGDPFEYFAAAHPWGLIEPLGWTTWCAPSSVEQDLFPLITRGGALGSFPWQGLAEWMQYLTSHEDRHPWEIGYYERGVLRPVMRLANGL